MRVLDGTWRLPAVRVRWPAAASASLLALSLSSCNESLPAAPDRLTSGLVIYEDANYLGESALVTQSIASLKDFEGPCEHTDDDSSYHDWNDCISSVRIAPGWRATLHRSTDYGNEWIEVTADIPNLQLVRGGCDHGGLNDCVSSIRVTPP